MPVGGGTHRGSHRSIRSPPANVRSTGLPGAGGAGYKPLHAGYVACPARAAAVELGLPFAAMVERCQCSSAPGTVACSLRVAVCGALVIGLGMALLLFGGLAAIYPLPFGDGGSCGSLLFRRTVRDLASVAECRDKFHDRQRLVTLVAGPGILLLAAYSGLAFRRGSKHRGAV